LQSVLLLEELGLHYELAPFRFDDVKKKPFVDVNPNGRVPAIHDPNTDLTLWESGAINQYIVEQYDTEHRLSSSDFKEKHLMNQWLQFQMSGQGPYFGQCGWFQHLHHEKLPSATERYANEIRRVLSVIEGVLAQQQSDWLVGNKMSYTDMAFLPWNFRLSEVLVQSWDEVWEGLPLTRAWHECMAELPSWKRIMKARDGLMAQQNLQWNGIPVGINSLQEYNEKIAKGEDTTGK
jgi:glutathione S-transferase